MTTKLDNKYIVMKIATCDFCGEYVEIVARVMTKLMYYDMCIDCFNKIRKPNKLTDVRSPQPSCGRPDERTTNNKMS
jgi:transcription elongation factor Elf1